MTEPRYILRAFVCAGGVVHPASSEGYAELSDILAQRSGGCRYAILQDLEGFIVADLFDLMWFNSRRDYMVLGKHHQHQTYDAAVLAANMTYLLSGPLTNRFQTIQSQETYDDRTEV